MNGTREDDWPAVAALAAREDWVLPSFGLHPWYVNERSPLWKEKLLAQLDAHPGCGVGEIGLDRWIAGFDIESQTRCFRWQLAIAAERNLPATIHCIRASGALWDIIRCDRLPERGFLLHAYGGPAEMTEDFVKRGAYFSFPPYFLHARKAAQRAAFQSLPIDRILMETDAPDLAPPVESNPHPLDSGLNDPRNITTAYRALAALRGVPLAELSAQVAKNFTRWSGGGEV